MDAAEFELFGATLRRAAETNTGAALDSALAELGWHQALADDVRAAVPLLFAVQGEAGVTSSALDDVIADALGTDAGSGIAVVLPGLGRWEPPGRPDAGRVVVCGLATARLLRVETVVVATAAVQDDDPSVVSTAVVKTAELTRRPVSGMDPWLGLVEVTGTATPVGPTSTLRSGAWSAVVTRARLAIGYELVGASSAMLQLARVHALERVQFGQPVSAFQAVRHRLADTLVAIESARALLEAAWDDTTDETAAMAKAVAGRAARTAARHCQQVLAGMGFTTEHSLHRYVRRVLVLDELFGSARSLTAALGHDVLSRRRLPPAFPL